MVLVLYGNTFRKYSSAMPLAGNNSWAISTACHQPDDDKNAAYERLMWGAMRHPGRNALGHCCFTTHQVEPPIIGERYNIFSVS
jgi:hypothetical protein